MTPFDHIASAKIVASSLSSFGARLDTLQVRYWRPIHGEVMTHRVFSRNAASGRAVPILTVLGRNETYVPRFRKNKPGMQAGDYLHPVAQLAAEGIWNRMAAVCREGCEALGSKDGLNVHKQWANRPMEWFGWIDVLISSTEWSNFDALRIHDDAQDEMKLLAELISLARLEAKPRQLLPGDWHLPYVVEEDYDRIARAVRDRALPDEARMVLHLMEQARGLYDVSDVIKLKIATSAARCCRLSYAKLDGTPASLQDEMRRYLQLGESAPLHASPFEHQARGLGALEDPALQGNFTGFAQYRKFLPNECL